MLGQKSGVKYVTTYFYKPVLTNIGVTRNVVVVFGFTVN